MEATRNIYFIKEQLKDKISVVLPCAGLCTRLRMKTHKSLLDINGDSLISKNIKNIKSIYPNSDITVVCGNQIEIFRKILKNENVKIVYNQRYEDTNTAYSIGLGLDVIDTKRCLIIMGDLYYNKESIQNIDVNDTNKILEDNGSIEKNEIGFITDENNRVSRFNFISDRKWSQICYISGKTLEIFREKCYDDENNKCFTYEILNKCINLGHKFEVIKVKKSCVYDIDTLSQLYKAIEYDNQLRKIK